MSASLLTFLGNALWQVALLCALAAALGRLLHRSPARVRHVVHAVTLVACVATPLASALIAGQTVSASEAVLAQGQHTVSLLERAAGVAPRFSLGRFSSSALLAIAALFSLGRTAQLIQKALRTRALAGSSYTPLTGNALQIERHAAKQLGVQRARVVASRSIPGPITFGHFRPKIVVPIALTDASNAELLRAALGHEFAHVRRNDFLWNLLFELLVAALAFHPGVWFLKRRIDDTRELACDEVVASELVERQTYARCLLSLARAALECERPGDSDASCALPAVAPPFLEGRLWRLLAAPPRPRRGLLAITLLVLALGAGASTRVAFAISSASPAALPDEGSSASEVDWLLEGNSACNVGDLVSADVAWRMLGKEGRRKLTERCALRNIWRCDAGFSYQVP